MDQQPHQADLRGGLMSQSRNYSHGWDLASGELLPFSG